MKVVFRVDASLSIGTGHVMRCLTLAQALANEGAECHFICREHPGHMIEAIRTHGFSVYALQANATIASNDDGVPQTAHAAWLGANWQEDAQQTREQIKHLAPAWLVVDHYALDKCWEQAVKPDTCRLLVIDDLADREHYCDLLLDQNLGRQAADYASLVPKTCVCLIGPEYALLRPEFAQMRNTSLTRRVQPQLKHLLVTMGGIDKDNATGAVLSALCDCPLPDDCQITVIMGANAPWLDHVENQVANMPWLTQVVVNVENMAERMCSADLAIGAAGSTSWERCCLALPTLIVILADNQLAIAEALDRAGAAITLASVSKLSELPQFWQDVSRGDVMLSMSKAAAMVTSGNGTILLVRHMIGNAV